MLCKSLIHYWSERMNRNHKNRTWNLLLLPLHLLRLHPHPHRHLPPPRPLHPLLPLQLHYHLPLPHHPHHLQPPLLEESILIDSVSSNCVGSAWSCGKMATEVFGIGRVSSSLSSHYCHGQRGRNWNTTTVSRTKRCNPNRHCTNNNSGFSCFFVFLIFFIFIPFFFVVIIVLVLVIVIISSFWSSRCEWRCFVSCPPQEIMFGLAAQDDSYLRVG